MPSAAATSTQPGHAKRQYFNAVADFFRNRRKTATPDLLDSPAPPPPTAAPPPQPQPSQPSADHRELIEHLNLRVADLQNQIQQLNRMAELGSLTAAVAHEVLGALNIIKNYSDMNAETAGDLTEAIPASDATDDAAYLRELCADLVANSQTIARQSLRATQIVNTILMSSQNRSEQLQPVAINELIADHVKLAYQAVRTTNPDTNAVINHQFDDQIGDIIAIPSDIGRAIINVATNAFHATHERKQLDPDHRPAVTVTTAGHTETVSVSIHDNGVGMPKTVADNIFSPFFTTKPPEAGTGLGMSITKDIIDQHHGSIAVNTNPGVDTEIVITLPRIPPELQR